MIRMQRVAAVARRRAAPALAAFALVGLAAAPVAAQDAGLQRLETDLAEIEIKTSTGDPATVSLATEADWLTLSALSGTAPSILTVSVNAAGLAPGVHTASIEASAEGLTSEEAVAAWLRASRSTVAPAKAMRVPSGKASM